MFINLYFFMIFYLTGDKAKLTKMVQMAWTFVNDRYKLFN